MSHTTIIIHSNNPAGEEARVAASITYTPSDSETPMQVGAQVAKILRKLRDLEEGD